MHANAIRSFILIASCLAAAPVVAGVGGQTSGVTSTIGNQGTNASPEVQQQSAGFVQQNQQAQNAQNPVSPTGIVVPGAVANAAGARGDANAASPDAGGKPGDPNNPAATPATPPPPPPPPPTYVSVVKHLSPGPNSGDPVTATATAATAADATPAATPAIAPGLVKTDTPPAAAPAPVKTPAPVVSAPANAAGNTEKIGANERAAETGVVSGGRGPAPDGYTFYVGFAIALLLLAIAFGAYLSSQKDEAGRRS